MDRNIRQMAAEVMHRVLRGLPDMRNAMLQGMAAFVSRLTDDLPEVYASSYALRACCGGVRCHITDIARHLSALYCSDFSACSCYCSASLAAV